ncbi:YeeE/YedE family protein [Aerophototrophica crusticola]|uniref:YeeE/YedE family protein n=1 Tax=Aerophototrophica crusticola TaxID=1709002 RepID=A0A858R4G9_9PROT|nr:YeeE/YedE family protein [Rhodospirillaceae bacterium B3]
MSSWWLLPVSLPLAFIVGLAAQKGSICAVAGVEELLSRKRPDQLLAILACALWVAVVTVPLHWLSPGYRLASSLDTDWAMLAGGVAFGVGAAVNKGCAHSTLSRCASGNVAGAMTVLGMLAGLILLTLLPVMVRSVERLETPSPLTVPQPWSAALVAALALVGAVLVAGLVRRRAWRDAWARPRWNPYAATAVMGVAGGSLYALHGPWTYTALLPRALGQPVSPDSPPTWLPFVLTLAVMAGGMVSATLADRVRLRFSPKDGVRFFAGGMLMGAGGALAAGGNDVLVLHALPALAAHALPTYLAIMAGVALLRVPRRWRKKD